MKQKDIALYIVIAAVSSVVSVLASNYFFTPSAIKQQKAEVVEAITADFDQPAKDNKYFNKDAINPTKLIQIGDSPANSVPFNGTGN